MQLVDLRRCRRRAFRTILAILRLVHQVIKPGEELITEEVLHGTGSVAPKVSDRAFLQLAERIAPRRLRRYELERATPRRSIYGVALTHRDRQRSARLAAFRRSAAATLIAFPKAALAVINRSRSCVRASSGDPFAVACR